MWISRSRIGTARVFEPRQKPKSLLGSIYGDSRVAGRPRTLGRCLMSSKTELASVHAGLILIAVQAEVGVVCAKRKAHLGGPQPVLAQDFRLRALFYDLVWAREPGRLRPTRRLRRPRPPCLSLGTSALDVQMCRACGRPVSNRAARYCSRGCWMASDERRRRIRVFWAERVTQSDPTQEQIAAECKLIQAMWSDAERVGRMRVDWRPIGWEVRLVAAADDAVTAGGRADRVPGQYASKRPRE